MSHDTTDAETGVPVQFERNRYFHGKLMTARDMTADQDYVRRRLAAVSRGVLGAGVVAGLDVTGAEDDDGDLRVTVTPGVALDSAGRTVVVPEGTGQVTVHRPGVDDPFPIGEVTAEGVALTLRYDHCSTERVPAPGNEHAGGDGSEYGRVVETFVVEAGSAEGGVEPPKPVTEVSLPGPEETPDEAGRRMAAEAFTSSTAPTPLVLATVRRDESDALVIGEVPRPLVYPNDLVYAAAVTHATDRENPHGVAVGQVEGAVASVGGATPDEEGAVAVRSDSGAVTVDSDGNALVFDSDALRSLGVEGGNDVSGGAEGRIRFYSPDSSVALSTDAGRIGLRADALRSVAVEGDETIVTGGEDRQVTLHSPDGSVTITTNGTGDRIGFAAAVEGGEVDLEGVLRELQGLADHGGAIEFVSSNDSVAVEQVEDREDALDVRVTDGFVDRLRERLVEDLRGDDDGDGRVIPIDEIRDAIREDIEVDLRESIRTDVEESFRDRLEEVGRTNETLLTQLNRLGERAEPVDQPVTVLEGLTLSNANDLRERGIVSVGDLAEASDEDLLAVSGVGEATLTEWRTRIDERLGQ